MPSRCIFFFSAFRAWSTLLSRTRTCTLAPSLLLGRVKAKAPQFGGFESGGSSRKGVKSPLEHCKSACRTAILHMGRGVSLRQCSARPDPCHMTHLAARPRLALAIDMHRCAGDGQPA